MFDRLVSKASGKMGNMLKQMREAHNCEKAVTEVKIGSCRMECLKHGHGTQRRLAHSFGHQCVESGHSDLFRGGHCSCGEYRCGGANCAANLADIAQAMATW